MWQFNKSNVHISRVRRKLTCSVRVDLPHCYLLMCNPLNSLAVFKHTFKNM